MKDRELVFEAAFHATVVESVHVPHIVFDYYIYIYIYMYIYIYTYIHFFFGGGWAVVGGVNCSCQKSGLVQPG